jgi:hypothetical protein
MDAPRLLPKLSDVRRSLTATGGRAPAQAVAIERALVDLGALEFHLGPMPARLMVVLLGGTGTGKSTLANRLLEAREEEFTASNFRRTFTAGPVALAASAGDIPSTWLGLPHVVAESLPARGEAGRLVVVPSPVPSSLLGKAVLVDTPDVDGDQPPHHALADRAFRFANAAVFVASPEKYQMTELLPYYRLAQRYGVPALFIMNKVEDRAVVDDFAQQLVSAGFTSPRVFVQPRDDSTFAAAAGETVADLREAVDTLALPAEAQRQTGLRRRVEDLALRVVDQILEPLRVTRHAADVAIDALRELRARDAGVDVDPMTRQLRKRMQQRSILYLMGPQRMLERLRAAPAMFAKLPRSTIDLFRGKSTKSDTDEKTSKVELPDFAAIVADQFAVAQERMADVIRAHLPATADADASWRIDRAHAAEIVTTETDALRAWLEQRWNSSPRDTALILKVVQKLPGGQRLTRLSESAPYLVVIACGLNHLAFSGLDLLVIGGFSLATWLGEKLSDEVAQRTRQANKNIDIRFAELLRRQANEAIAWLAARIPATSDLDALARHLDDLRELAEGGNHR